jgi:two-component system sensor histidine kinase CpxA
MRLFLKIFLSYWLAQALFLVLAILVAFALRPPSEVTQMEAQGPKILDQAIQQFHNGGSEAARRYLRAAHDQYQVHFALVNEQGVDLSGRKPPDFIERVVRGQERTADSFWGRLGPARFLRYATNSFDGHRYTLIIAFPPEEHQLFSIHGVPGLGIIIAIISSGLVCYFLARFVTAPVVRLREATQRLAAGDLSARAGAFNEKGRDEIAHLVRDFDAMAERLQSLVNAQSRLLNDISHELRSPLARLNVALGLARRRTGPDAGPTLDRIEHEAERLNELIGRLLTVARLESGEDGVSRAPVDLEALLQEVAQDADYEAQSRNCHVRVTAETPCVVDGNRALLRSAVENVIRNAIRYTAEGTDVSANLLCEQGTQQQEAVIEVLDSGPGVPEEALDKLFRPFYRIDDARGRQTGGVGLGLSITDRAVRWHHGSVSARNRPEGGLRVEIRLPLAHAPVNRRPRHTALTASEK